MAGGEAGPQPRLGGVPSSAQSLRVWREVWALPVVWVGDTLSAHCSRGWGVLGSPACVGEEATAARGGGDGASLTAVRERGRGVGGGGR